MSACLIECSLWCVQVSSYIEYLQLTTPKINDEPNSHSTFTTKMSAAPPTSIELGAPTARGSDYAHLQDVALDGDDAGALLGHQGSSVGSATAASLSPAIAASPAAFSPPARGGGGGGRAPVTRGGVLGCCQRAYVAWTAPTTGIPGTTFNLTNSVIGAGIISGNEHHAIGRHRNKTASLTL